MTSSSYIRQMADWWVEHKAPNYHDLCGNWERDGSNFFPFKRPCDGGQYIPTFLSSGVIVRDLLAYFGEAQFSDCQAAVDTICFLLPSEDSKR